MTRMASILAAGMAAWFPVEQTAPYDYPIRIYPLLVDRPPPIAIPKPDNPMALLGKHAGKMRKGKRIWRA